MICLKSVVRILAIVLVATVVVAEASESGAERSQVNAPVDGSDGQPEVELLNSPTQVDLRTFLLGPMNKQARSSTNFRSHLSDLDDDHSNIDLNRLNQAYHYDVPLNGNGDDIRVGDAYSLSKLFRQMRQVNSNINNYEQQQQQQQQPVAFYGSQWKRNFRSLIPKEDKDYSFVSYANPIYNNNNNNNAAGPSTTSGGSGIGGWSSQLLRDYMQAGGRRLRFTNTDASGSLPRAPIQQQPQQQLVSKEQKQNINDYLASNNNNLNSVYIPANRETREKRIKCKMPVSAGVKNPANCEIDSYLNVNAYDDFGTSWDPVGRR